MVTVFVVQDYTSGELLTGYLKKELIELLQPIVRGHRERRQQITDDTITLFTTPRKLNYTPPPPNSNTSSNDKKSSKKK